LKKKVDQQALGQILSSGPVGERSSTHWRGSGVRTVVSGTADLRGVKWDSESDSESSHRQMNASNDEEAQKISQVGHIESSWNSARRIGDSNTGKATSDKNDFEVIAALDNKKLKNGRYAKRRQQKLTNDTAKVDTDVIEALDKMKLKNS